jgi:thiol-disulfide isomerase/thioredoxin
MKKLLSGLFLVTLTVLGSRAADPVKTTTGSTGSVVYLTNETFKQQVFNYEVNEEWKYAGTLPAIVDFYADWCGPCRMVSPVLEELAKEYQGRIIVYKVDTQKERLLSQKLGI